MFLLAVLYKIIPAWFILLRIVFIWAGLGVSSSCPHGDGWKWGRVGSVGRDWGCFLLATTWPLQAMQCLGGEMSLKSCGEAKGQGGCSYRQSSPLFSPTHHPMQMAAYKTCFLWWDSCRKAAENETHRLVELEKTKPFNTCLYAFLIKARGGLIFQSQKSID